MVKFLKKGKVVILLNGRYAGSKAVIVNTIEGSKGTKAAGYNRAVVVGIARGPLKVTNTMSRKKVAKRTRIKPYIKTVNLNHVLPTRYNFDTDLSTVITSEPKDPVAKAKVRKEVRKVFQQRYSSGKQKWFFTKLRF